MHPETRVAVVFDWDRTLSPHYMQQVIFQEYDINEGEFWALCHARVAANVQHLGTRCFVEHEYLNLMLDYARTGVFADLDNEKLKLLGGRIRVNPGVSELLNELHDSPGVEVHIVSSGLRTMLLDHPAVRLNPANIHGAEFTDYELVSKPGNPVQRVKTPSINSIAKSLLPSDKVRILAEIAKGCHQGRYDSCVPMRPEEFPVPYSHMIYVGDGVTDIYAFRTVRENGGYAVGVYDPASETAFRQIEMIRRDGLLDVVGPTDFHPQVGVGSWILRKVETLIDEAWDRRRANQEARYGELRSHAPDYMITRR